MTARADEDRIRELEQDNRRLRRSLDMRDAPRELRHRLRSTFALLSAIIRKSAQTPRDQASYANHLEDRLDAIARTQALADQYGEVSLHTILSEELLKYNALESDRVVLSGPQLSLWPRAGQILALAIHELTINSVEHGALGLSDGNIEVRWSVRGAEPNTALTICWSEPENRVAAQPSHTGFGTEILTRMLLYELEATTTITYDSHGVNCAIRIPCPLGSTWLARVGEFDDGPSQG